MLKDLNVGTLRRYLPYLLGLVMLIVIIASFKLFWRSIDDVAMSNMADGGGQVMTPGPHLVLTNIAWGYVVYALHLLGDPWAYATMIYVGLALSYVALLYAFMRSDIDHPVAAVLLLFVYAPTLIYPQHTLVAGYLAFAGIVLLCQSVNGRSLRGGYLAGTLLVLSSLVRWDETAFVCLVAVPFCLKYWSAAWNSDLRKQWLWLLGITAAVGAGFLILDFLTFGHGEWKEFADTYKYMMEFNDFKVGEYFYNHRPALAGSGYSVNDVTLFGEWFYCDPSIFSPDKLASLLDRVPPLDNLQTHLREYRKLLEPLGDSTFQVLAVSVLILICFHRRRWHLAASVVALALLMLLLLALGRPQVTRIYLPASAALLLIAALDLEKRSRWLTGALLTALMAVNLAYLVNLHKENVMLQKRAIAVQAATCRLPRDELFVNWGSAYPFTLNYLPFGSPQACDLNYYSLGGYSLAPFALDHLHRYTSGKDLIPALLAGQQFDFIANAKNLPLLRRYVQEHYRARLNFDRKPDASFSIFHVSVTPAAGTAASAVEGANP
jgi:hypothetical protein